MKNLDAFKAHGDIIWNIANLLRGPYRPPQYRRVMIPLTVLRRLDCVLEASKEPVVKYHRQLKEQTDKDGKAKYDVETIEKMVFRKFDLSFFNTSEFTFQKLLGDPDKLAANLRNYMAGFSGRARKIIEKFKFDEEIEKLEEANRLFEVVKEIAAVDFIPRRSPTSPWATCSKTWCGASTNKPTKRPATTSRRAKSSSSWSSCCSPMTTWSTSRPRSSRSTTPPAAPAACSPNRKS
jgi:hypothetical protein